MTPRVLFGVFEILPSHFVMLFSNKACTLLTQNIRPRLFKMNCVSVVDRIMFHENKPLQYISNGIVIQLEHQAHTKTCYVTVFFLKKH